MSRGFRVAPNGPSIPNVEVKLMTAQKGRPLTPAQREARRRNGQKSTGPRTPTGKRIVSLNAVNHGVYSCPPI
jgi:hypothetical protein